MSGTDRKPPYQSLLIGPVTDDEPRLLHDVPMDNIVGAMVVLAGEIHRLRERLKALEAELEEAKAIAPGAVERHEWAGDKAEELARELDAFVNRFWAELARDRTPVSHIDPRVKKYLDE